MEPSPALPDAAPAPHAAPAPDAARGLVFAPPVPPGLAPAAAAHGGIPRSGGGNLDDLRRRNLAAVLRLTHISGGLSRAELTRQTGLNRSTVGALVADLAEAGFVAEQQAVRSGGVGRPSPMVVPTEQVKVLAINPEIDATAGALVGLGGKVFATGSVPHATIPSTADVVAAIGQLVAQFSAQVDQLHKIQGIGLAVPGLVRAETGVVAIAPHLRWRDEPLGELVAQQFPTTVRVENDANCGVIAETLFGAGEGGGSVVYLNGGASGIGGGIVSGDSLVAGMNGFGGEFGHTLVNSSGMLCHCGSTGCLETEVRRSALLQLLPGTEVTELDAELVRSCQQGNEAVIAEVDRQLHYLGVALRTVVNVINPQRIILGGFLASLVRARGTTSVQQAISQTLAGSAGSTDILPAALGPHILAVGAAELVMREVISHPLR